MGSFCSGGLKCFMRTLLLLPAHCEASGLFLLLGFRVIEIRAVGVSNSVLRVENGWLVARLLGCSVGGWVG